VKTYKFSNPANRFIVLMRSLGRGGSSIVLVVLTSSILLFASIPVGAQAFVLRSGTHPEIVDRLDWEAVVVHGRALSSYSSRVTGYEGYYDSIEYITGVLASYGLAPIYQEFTVLVPFSLGAEITLVSSGETLQGFPLEPNLVALSSTPPDGVAGPLVYVGRGGKEFDGRTLNGCVVLMRMDSKDEWVTAASLGAKAVIFYAEVPITKDEAEYKRLNVAFNFPRVLVEKEVADRLLSLAESEDNRVVLKSRVTWREVAAENIFVTIPGEINETVVLATHFDSWSVAMDRSPGAREAMNVGLLLELAKLYKDHRPYRTLVFAFLSGYHQNMAGAREFVEEIMRSSPTDRFIWDSNELKLFIGLDLGTRGNRVTLAYAGWEYNYYLAAGGSQGGLSAQNRYLDLHDAINREIIPKMGEYGTNVDNALNDTPRGVWEAFMSVPLSFDHEAYTVAGGTGLTIFTSYDRRDNWNTPDDTVDKMELDELRGQALTALAFIEETLRLPTVPLHSDSVPTRFSSELGGGGFATVTGTVVKYDFRSAWYKALSKDTLMEDYGPNATALIHAYLWFPALTFPLSFSMIIKPNDLGNFTIHGVPALNTWWSTTRFTSGEGVLTTALLIVEPYVVDEYGCVLAAPDFGRYGCPQRLHLIDKPEYKIDRATVFDTGSLVLFDLGEFQYTDVLKTEVVNEPSLAPLGGGDVVFDASGHVPTDFQFASTAATSDVRVVYVPPNSLVEVIASTSRFPYPNIVLNNKGAGYNVSRGEQLVLYDSLWETAQNLAFIVGGRLAVTSSYNVHSLLAEPLHAQAGEYFTLARASYDSGGYSRYESLMRTGWNYEYLAYTYTRQLYDNVINTISVFSTLLVLASLLLAQLVFGSLSILKRIFANVGVFLVFVAILFIFHPGFHLASSTIMVLVGLVSVLLLTPVQAILVGLFADQLRQFRQKMMGLHFAEISRTSAVMMAFTMGIENMRKRRFRTILTCVSLSIMVFSLTALTSLPDMMLIRSLPVREDSPYTGIMLRRDDWQSMSPGYMETLSERLEGIATVHPRAWLYAKGIRRGVIITGSSSLGNSFELLSGSERVLMGAVLGMTPGDPLIKECSSKLLTEGSRWFIPSEEDAKVCVIAKNLSRSLGVGVGDTVKMLGLDFQIVGLFNETFLKNSTLFEDMDKRSIVPIDTKRPGQSPLDPSVVMMIPYLTSLELEGRPTSVALAFNDTSIIGEYAKELGIELSLNPYYGVKGEEVSQMSIYTSISLLGLRDIAMLMAVIMLIIFNMMLGVVKERTREIGILSAVGLSPLHVSFMFLAEIAEYAVMSALFGYVAGIVGIAVIRAVAPSYSVVFNFSSDIVLISLGISILATVVASLVPIREASRMATPSLIRKWEITTKPMGLEWTIPLPFSSAPDELPGILVFLEEYIASHVQEGMGNFIASETAIGKVKYGDQECPAIRTRVLLPPYDQGISQEVHLTAVADKSRGMYNFVVQTERLTGMEGIWKRSNPLFVDELRKQFLVWRGLREGDRRDYVEKGKVRM